MARPRKSLLEEKLRKKGLRSFDRESLEKFHEEKFKEYLELERELNNRLEPARRLVGLLEELRRILCDNNVWTVVKKTLEDPGAITAEVTRGYGMDHREALSKISWLIEQDYITRSDLELDPIRERYVKHQYPGSRLMKLLRKISEAINEYNKTYIDVLKLKAKIADTVEAFKLAERYMKHYLKQV